MAWLRRLRDAWLYFTVVPAVCFAVLLLAGFALRASVQVERSRQQSIFDATWSVASERVDRLDKMIIAQDNVVAATVDIARLGTLGARWLPTSARETPTVRAVVVLDVAHPSSEIRAFVSPNPGPEDEAFRRLLVHRLLPQLKLHSPPEDQLRHLHRTVAGRSYLVSYWQRLDGDRPLLIVVWHDVSRLVHEVMPQIYSELDRNSRMNVIDGRGRVLFGPAIRASGPLVSLPFPTTLYDWRLQVALTSAEGLEESERRQRLVTFGLVGLAAVVVIAATIALVRAARQERRLAGLKGDFVANVSHELKTPLASVRMFGEMLLTGRVPNDDKRREYLQIIVGESERLTALIDNVLDFAKVERGKDAYDFAEGDLLEVARRAVDNLRYRAERQGILLGLEGTHGPCILDERAVELAVMNLIDNALKYARGTKVVRVAVEPLAKGGAKVSVSDEGPGIDAEERARIFDRFVRGKEAREGRTRGSGIGLALVKHIAGSHGGTVKLDSRGAPPTGATFELVLPAKPPRYGR
ncbi:MAG: HAMP domain-containing histidine kinase [Deltaproteobacteria bacterium]|nr:HAMP domain-containing histidine kinase [Deltaproteobacteria bacterium]